MNVSDDRRWQRHLGQPVLEVPGVGRQLVRWVPAGEQVAGRVGGVRRDAGSDLAPGQLVRRVVGARRPYPAIDQGQPVSHGIIRVCDVVPVRPAPLLVRQLVGLVVAPGHPVAGGFDDAQAVADAIESVGEARKRRAGRAQIGHAQEPAGVVVQVRGARRVGEVNAGDAAGRVIAPGCPLAPAGLVT